MGTLSATEDTSVRENAATTESGTVAWVFAKTADAQRGVARLKAAGFGDVRISERSGTTSAEHVPEDVGRTTSDFAAALEAAGFAAPDARAVTDAVAAGGTLITLAAGSRANDALAVLRGETVTARPVSAVDPTSAATAATAAAATPRRPVEAPAHAEPAEPRVLELREERLDVRRERDESEARIRKEVVTEDRTITVPMQREELVVERDGEDDVRIPMSSDHAPP